MRRRATINISLGLGLLLVSSVGGCRCGSDLTSRQKSLDSDAKGVFRFRQPGWALAESASLCPLLDTGKIHRFIEGLDTCMVVLGGSELDALDDAFVDNVLKQGVFPDTVDSVVAAMAATGWSPVSYVVGEGSQVPLDVAGREAERNLRYVVAWGPDENDARVFLSAVPGGRSPFLQVLAWDEAARRFNFYEWRPQIGGTAARAWSWVGDSGHATAPETRGHGCFDCHHNGVPIMKELVAPWNNWHSQLATVSSWVAPTDVATEELFENRRGAEVLEQAIRGRYQTYYAGWLRQRFLRQSDGTTKLVDVDRMLRHLIVNTTINFASSQVQSRGFATTPPNADVDGIPSNFYVWDDVLRTTLSLDYEIPNFSFDRTDYDAYLQQHQFRLVQEVVPGQPPAYEQPGSTWFWFFVPIPAFEDHYMVSQLRSTGIVPDKFIAAVVMVDFVNPVFSEARARLQVYAEQISGGTIDANGVSSVPTAFAELVRAAAAKQPACASAELLECAAEQQFLATWDAPDQEWKAMVQARISAYFDELGELDEATRMDALMRLADERRERFSRMPIIGNLNEFSLLLPRNDL